MELIQLDKNIEVTAVVLRQLIKTARQQQDETGIRVGVSPTLVAALKLLQQKSWLNAHWPIAWPTWPPGVWAKIVALAQKLIRRLLKWYIDPIVRQQNEFNQAALSALRVMAREVAELRAASSQDRRAQQARLNDIVQQLDVRQQTLEE